MPDTLDLDTTWIVVLCRRVSAADKEEDLPMRLLHLKDLCGAQGWSVDREYVRKALAADFTIKITTKKTGRPKVTDRPGFEARYETVLERLRAGDISKRRAAKDLGIGYATLKRLIDGGLSTKH